jgi:hypothetical protein
MTITTPHAAPRTSPALPGWEREDLVDKLPHCFPRRNGDPASKPHIDSPTKCIQELTEFDCDDIDQLIADMYKHHPPGSSAGMPTKDQLEKTLAPMLNKINKDKNMITALASAFVGSVDKLQCAVDSLNTAYELKGSDKLQSLPVTEIKSEMAKALDCCKMCATSTKGIIIAVIIAVLAIGVTLLIRFI